MKRKAILLVDDEQLIIDSLARELSCEGLDLDITRATSGTEAISLLNNGSFDLVVTDLQMPGMDGFQVLKAAKRKDALTMVIILTGYADLEAAIDALRLGADDFLQKPCDTDELLYRISNCFVKQAMQKKIALYENILPVCSYCHKIRDDRQTKTGEGPWYSLEEYFSRVQGINFSHGCCPACFAKEMGSYIQDKGW
jgi:YesN/AraC family two-component response regulator